MAVAQTYRLQRSKFFNRKKPPRGGFFQYQEINFETGLFEVCPTSPCVLH